MSEGDQITRGERGPKGDHGQGGDIGLTGLPGETGHEGIPGEKGERGDTGPPGKSSILARNVSASFIVLVVVSTLVLGILGWNINKNRGLARDGAAAKEALCAFRANLQDRAKQTAEFIANVESGERPPINGITVGDLQQSLNAQRSTLRSLHLDCP